jgi:hypothetical protein
VTTTDELLAQVNAGRRYAGTFDPVRGEIRKRCEVVGR